MPPTEQHGPPMWADAPAGFAPSSQSTPSGSPAPHGYTPPPGLGDAPTSRRRAVNALIVLSCICSAALAASAVTPRMDGVGTDAPVNDLSAVAFLASIAAAVTLCWRLRSLTTLLVVTGIVCLPGLLLPTDSLPALIAMASVIVWHPDIRARLAATTGATLTTFVATWRDTRGTRSDTSVWNSLQHSNGTPGQWPPMPWWQVALITAMLVGTFAGIALMRRARRDATRADARAHQARADAEQEAWRAHHAQLQAQEFADRERRAQAEAHHAATQAQQAQEQAQDLGRQLAEQDEREAIAREVHDVLGHRLSILSMQANALEIEAQQANSADVEERARQIQQGASGSMDDLRALLAMLRTGSATPEHHDLADIADLVRECIDAGTPVSSNVFVDQTHPLDAVISASAYRVVTELLTNARKHAPGELVQLDIRGDANAGIVITTTNPLGADAENVRSGDAGTGLMGVAKRVQAIGGFFEAGASPDGVRFVAQAHLPWVLPGRTQTPLR